MFVVRHGQRADQADGEWWLTAARPADPPLTDLGLQQAAATGEALAPLASAASVIYSSPFTRCVQTAAQIANKLGLRIRIEPGIGEELHADWFDFSPRTDCGSGMPIDEEMSTAAIAARFGHQLIDTTYEPLYDARERGGQSRGSGGSRTMPPRTITFPEAWHEANERYRTTLAHLQEVSPFSVLVTHGAGVQACGESCEGVDMAEIDIDYCCIQELRRQGVYQWKPVTLASAKHTQHLE